MTTTPQDPGAEPEHTAHPVDEPAPDSGARPDAGVAHQLPVDPDQAEWTEARRRHAVPREQIRPLPPR